ncbi:unnamed protein product [Ostreobium quekettii]|uniref:Ankyrin repeat protein n=1 Tax=Ostreobium quekettii TaxID=121088 RepID=A0A8S1J1Q6_9CHLO|nr:unnamed protein product [Ostreobium quekettii]|eukprot:evm.model.scf_2590.2 EVM.evm.TU.scf_2590.2   scf_2590:8932-11667(+)
MDPLPAWQAIFWAIHQGDLPALAGLLNNGADPDARDPHGNTPLIKAARAGLHSAVGLLCGRGADTNAQNNAGLAALHEASRNGHGEAIRALLGQGAQADARSGAGETPLGLAVGGGHAGAVAVLLQGGADPEARMPDDGSTALILATRLARDDVIRALLAGAADVTDLSAADQTELQAASTGTRSPAVLELLSGAGAQIDLGSAVLMGKRGGADAVTQGGAEQPCVEGARKGSWAAGGVRWRLSVPGLWEGQWLRGAVL